MPQLLTKIFDGNECLAASYSQIETYLQCPQQWYRRYVLGERISTPSIALAYGSSIHLTLEWFFKNGKKASEKKLIKTWEDFAEKENIPYENEKDKAKKIQMKYKFIDWIKWYNSELTDAEIEYLQEYICKVNLYD